MKNTPTLGLSRSVSRPARKPRPMIRERGPAGRVGPAPGTGSAVGSTAAVEDGAGSGGWSRGVGRGTRGRTAGRGPVPEGLDPDVEEVEGAGDAQGGVAVVTGSEQGGEPEGGSADPGGQTGQDAEGGQCGGAPAVQDDAAQHDQGVRTGHQGQQRAGGGEGEELGQHGNIVAAGWDGGAVNLAAAGSALRDGRWPAPPPASAPGRAHPLVITAWIWRTGSAAIVALVARPVRVPRSPARAHVAVQTSWTTTVSEPTSS